MKSYLPATVLGFALTAAAFGFGAATAHAADVPLPSATQVSTEVLATGHAVQESVDLSGWLTPWTAPIH